MSTADRYRLLRGGYYHRLELGVLLALGVHAVVFAVAPPYVPRPFRLPSDQPLRLVEYGDAATSEPAPPAAGELRAIAMPEMAAVRSEQLEASPTPTSSGGGVAVTGGTAGSGSGAEGDAPPVFYAYDTAPRVVRWVEPEYPILARTSGLEGTVIINVNLDEAGRLMRAWVAQAAASEVLVTAALDAVYQFEFQPGKEGDHPVKCTVAVPFHFSLKRSQ